MRHENSYDFLCFLTYLVSVCTETFYFHDHFDGVGCFFGYTATIHDSSSFLNFFLNQISDRFTFMQQFTGIIRDTNRQWRIIFKNSFWQLKIVWFKAMEMVLKIVYVTYFIYRHYSMNKKLFPSQFNVFRIVSSQVMPFGVSEIVLRMPNGSPN